MKDEGGPGPKEGPTVMGTSRSMERGFRDLAEMLKFLVIQYMPTRTLIDYLGTDGIPATVFDYAPDMVIPSHMPGEQTVDPMGQPVPTSTDVLTRAKTFARNLRTFMTPHSMHYIAQAKQRLDTLALLGKGVPVDPSAVPAA